MQSKATLPGMQASLLNIPEIVGLSEKRILVSLPPRCPTLSREAGSGKVLIPRTTKGYAPGPKSLPREKEITYLVAHLPRVRYRRKKTHPPHDEPKKTENKPPTWKPRLQQTRTFNPTTESTHREPRTRYDRKNVRSPCYHLPNANTGERNSRTSTPKKRGRRQDEGTTAAPGVVLCALQHCRSAWRSTQCQPPRHTEKPMPVWTSTLRSGG